MLILSLDCLRSAGITRTLKLILGKHTISIWLWTIKEKTAFITNRIRIFPLKIKLNNAKWLENFKTLTWNEWKQEKYTHLKHHQHKQYKAKNFSLWYMLAYWSLYKRNNWWILIDQDRCSRNVKDVKSLNRGKELKR